LKIKKRHFRILKKEGSDIPIKEKRQIIPYREKEKKTNGKRKKDKREEKKKTIGKRKKTNKYHRKIKKEP